MQPKRTKIPLWELYFFLKNDQIIKLSLGQTLNNFFIGDLIGTPHSGHVTYYLYSPAPMFTHVSATQCASTDLALFRPDRSYLLICRWVNIRQWSEESRHMTFNLCCFLSGTWRRWWMRVGLWSRVVSRAGAGVKLSRPADMILHFHPTLSSRPVWKL